MLILKLKYEKIISKKIKYDITQDRCLPGMVRNGNNKDKYILCSHYATVLWLHIGKTKHNEFLFCSYFIRIFSENIERE